MSDDVTPSEVRARGFDVVRRGYDRASVDTYLASLATEIETLVAKVESRHSRDLKVGLDDPEALALELDAIGGEVAAILEAARNAADGMRSRASGDADQWRSSAEKETSEALTDAVEQSQSMRAAAWNEGTSMLSSSLAHARDVTDQAGDDALFIRAEAEREAIRLTGDARRDREESIRTVRMEAEQLLDGARRESDGILAAAGQKAEQAQERARALEDRRTELLAELESTRASIGTLEEEIESRRVELEAPDPVPEAEFDTTTHHSVDSGSVRIVSASRSVNLKPVDAEDLVADVVAIRTGAVVAPAPDTGPHEVETVTVISPPDTAPDEVTAPAETTPETVTPSSDVEPVAAPTSAAADTDGSSSDDIGSLFASLKSEPQPESPKASASAPETAKSKPKRKPKSKPPTADVEPKPAAAKSGVNETTLIPLQNDALRDIKRTLVDLQNDALENLRNDEAWTPPKTFTNRFKVPFADLAMGLTGSKKDDGAAKAFSADLHLAVSDAIVSARSAGAGGREIASAVSRVFRRWRADEAERRVADVARALASLSV